MKSVLQIRKEIHNLHQKKSRMKAKAKDPDGFLKKERQRHKKYYHSMPPEKKKALIKKNHERNKKNRTKCNEYQRKSYQKYRKRILANLKQKRIDKKRMVKL